MGAMPWEPEPEVSLVVPMFNEELAIEPFLRRVMPLMERICPLFEVVCVNDGSRDRTLQQVVEARRLDPRIKIIDLSRNFGKEPALTAGLDFSSGRAVIPLDADLQDPPELIAEMLVQWRAGYDVVLAARADRSSDSWTKRVAAAGFYTLMNKLGDVPIPKNVGDFRLMDRRVVEALSQLPERTRVMKGLFAWMGFRQVTIAYTRPARVSGTTKWRFGSLWRLALDGLVSFTTLPLKIWSYVGALAAAAALSYAFYTVIRTVLFGVAVPGYASLVTFVLFFSGLNLLGLGVLGEYVARIFLEVKHRPLYLVRTLHGLSTNTASRIAYHAPEDDDEASRHLHSDSDDWRQEIVRKRAITDNGIPQDSLTPMRVSTESSEARRTEAVRANSKLLEPAVVRVHPFGKRVE